MIVELTLAQALYVINRMRESDVRAFRARYPQLSRENYAMERFNASDLRYCLLPPNGEPVAIGGFQFATPGVASAWLIGTDEIRGHRKELVRFCRKAVTEFFNKGIGHRIQAGVLADLQWCRDFAEHFGLAYEGEQLKAGANGENIVFYGRV